MERTDHHDQLVAVAVMLLSCDMEYKLSNFIYIVHVDQDHGRTSLAIHQT